MTSPSSSSPSSSIRNSRGDRCGTATPAARRCRSHPWSRVPPITRCRGDSDRPADTSFRDDPRRGEATPRLRTQASPLAHEEARSSLGPRPSSGGRVGSIHQSDSPKQRDHGRTMRSGSILKKCRLTRAGDGSSRRGFRSYIERIAASQEKKGQKGQDSRNRRVALPKFSNISLE